MGMSDAFKKKTNTYKVNSDGKAPSGLKTGDTVVTGGGTYQITGVNSDGSYKSTKVNDTNTKTYTGSYSDAPATSTKGTSGGTNNTTSWNANTDYQKLINEAVAKGDYRAAAQYEQLRNQKINATGSQYATTNNYAGWLTGDYGTMGQQQMESGASWQDVLATYNSRYNKAVTTEGLQQYANDALQQEMWQYIQDAIRAENEQAPEDYTEGFYDSYTEEKPTYTGKYDPAIENLLNQILNRDDFSYDAAKDPLYQQYAAQYQQEGDRAMRETLAEAAAGAGGMNSYAITAAQQANNYYNSQLANKIPELYQLAYNMYLQDKSSMVEDLGLLQGMDDRQYNRYRDTMQDYYNDKNFAYGVYADAVQQGNWEQNFNYNQLVNDRNFNYGVAQDAIDQSWKGKEWNNDMAQQEIANNRYDAEVKREEAAQAKADAQEQAYALLELGQMPPASLLEAAGIDSAYASAYLKGIQAELVRKVRVSNDDDDDDVVEPPNDDDDDDVEQKFEDDKTESDKMPSNADLVVKAAKETSSPNLTEESLATMLELGWIVYDEDEDKFKRTMDFGRGSIR